MLNVVIYRAEDGFVNLSVNLSKETVWLTQSQLSELFDKNVRTISEHIANIFDEGELTKDSVIRKFRITAADAKSYNANHYNLDVIISVDINDNGLVALALLIAESHPSQKNMMIRLIVNLLIN